MNLDYKVPLNWFDLAALVVLLLGVLRGRKRGMSQELVDLVQWAVIICGGTFLYQPVGQMFAQLTSSSLLYSYVSAYLGIAVIIKLFFLAIKHSVGGKLVGSDVFRGGEYYLGMAAGMMRFACALLLTLAVLNARYFSPEEIAADEKFQKDVYGSTFFPGVSELQKEIFRQSLSGSFVKNHLEFILITPTAPRKDGFKQKEFTPP